MSSEWFFCQDLNIQDRIVIRSSEVHHIKHVLRKKAGAKITLVDGCGVVVSSTIVTVGKDEITVSVRDRTVYDKPERELIFCPAIPHQDSILETMMRCAIELGVTQIIPIVSDRSRFIKKDQLDKKMERWRRIVFSACKQCRQPWFPILELPVDLRDYLSILKTEDCIKLAGIEPVLQDQYAGTLSISSWSRNSKFVWLSGPEGGWSKKDLQLIRDNKVIPLTIGKLVLTAQTAGIAGLAVLSYLLTPAGSD